MNPQWEYDYQLTAVLGNISSIAATAHVQAKAVAVTTTTVVEHTLGHTPTTAPVVSSNPTASSGKPSVGSGKVSGKVQTPAAASGQGLRMTLFKGTHLRGKHVIRKASNVNFAWGNSAPPPSVSGSGYSVRWTGKLVAPIKDTYTISVIADSSVRVYIDHHLVIDNWSGKKSGNGMVTLPLTAGKHAIRVDYKETGANSTISLHWSTASMPDQVIPQEQLLAA